jgi:hypothetical protein
MFQPQFKYTIGSSRLCIPFAIVVALLGMAGCGTGQDQPQQEIVTQQNSGRIIFKPIEISPSPNGNDYNGRFQFVNNEPKSVRVSGFGEPKHGRFEPANIKYQVLKGGMWVDIRTTSSGLFLEYDMKPDEPYEFIVELDCFDEQDTPLTARIGLAEGRFWSEPFVLNWKGDRNAGKFASARKENFQKVRDAFAKAGFKEELLVGDDFCSRLLRSMMKEFPADGDAVQFSPFLGGLDVTPILCLDGTILIDFVSDKKIQHGRPQYDGRFVLDPRRFTRQWFQNARDEFVDVKWVDVANWMSMRLYDGSTDTEQEEIFNLQIIYSPIEKSKVPSEDDSKKAFNRVLDALDQWLKK